MLNAGAAVIMTIAIAGMMESFPITPPHTGRETYPQTEPKEVAFDNPVTDIDVSDATKAIDITADIDFTGNGFFCYFDSLFQYKIPDSQKSIAWHGGIINNIPVGFVLHIIERKIESLECYELADTGKYPFPKMKDITSYNIALNYDVESILNKM